MTPERWQQVDKLLESTLEIEPAERAAFLDRVCAGDQSLRAEVESLLAAHERAGSFIEVEALEFAAGSGSKHESVSLVGQTIGHYRIESKIAEGGMGVVYRTRDSRLDRSVAIKVLRPEVTGDPERKKRFIHEAKAASALNHPNIITIYEIDSIGGVDFIAMEFVNGRTLDRLIGPNGLSLEEVLKCAVQIADALATAHAAGIIHRDLKPANIMVTEDGRVKVVDFGLAKLAEKSGIPGPGVADSTQEGVILGTVSYMSPEQAEGKKIDPRSDIFSFGSVLYEMVTGQRAFKGKTNASTLAAILESEPKPPSAIVKTVPGELERIIARCLRKDPERRFQSMADLRLALLELKEESESNKRISMPRTAAASRWGPKLAITAGLLFVAAGAVAVWWVYRSSAGPSEFIINRLTSDSGLTTDPTLSPDGKLLAYASDRSGEGNLDIWVQQVAGREAIRLTQDKSDEYHPDFSPDGTRIVFRSDQDQGGIYLISTFGGEARRISKFGHRPRFSPDGRWIAFWSGELHSGSSGIYLVSPTEGEPKQFVPDFAIAKYPVWSEDGKRLVFWGARDSKTIEQTMDWWVAPLDGRPATATGAYNAFNHQGFSRAVIEPGDWLSGGNRIVFSASLGDSTNLWQIVLSPKTWRVMGPAQRITFGAGLETYPHASAGHLAFVNGVSNYDLWSLPVDANQAKVTAKMERLTDDATDESRPSISKDGKRIVFASTRSGKNQNIWLKDLESNKEVALTQAQSDQDFPIITPDGSQVAYMELNEHRFITYLMPVRERAAKKICDDCPTLLDWSPDGRKILYSKGRLRRIHLLDVTSSEKTELLKYSTNSLMWARFSPDGLWIAFVAVITAGRSRVFVAPFRDGAAPGESGWIGVTDGSTFDSTPRWSPDGRFLYFLSESDGFRCLFAQRLHPAKKTPVGPPSPVYHFHSARHSLTKLPLFRLEMSLSRDKIVLSLAETTGNIWMTKLQER